MNLKLINETNLRQWLEAIMRSGRRLMAPQPTAYWLLYREVATPQDIRLDFGKPSYSLKALLFPVTEPVLRFGLENGEVVVEEIDAADDGRDIVVFGARPCDAAAVRVLDHVFLAPDADPFYARRRRKMTVVGLSCTKAEPECFCTAVGLSPTASAGCDILLTPIGSVNGGEPSYLLESLTEAGETLLNKVGGAWQEVSDDEARCLLGAKANLDERVRKQMAGKESMGSAVAQLKEDFEKPVWEEVAGKCLGCGVCAFVCPTCHCFDLVDEGDLRKGVRCKNWDSCCFAQFTLHGSGHNPRPTQTERYRQRVMHKFCYFEETAGMTMCTGCGRCIKLCPVGLDIYEVRKRWK